MNDRRYPGGSVRYHKEEIQMNKLAHAAGRKAFSAVINYALGQVNKNREQAMLQIIETIQKQMKELQEGVDWDYLKRVAGNPEYTLNRYINSMVDELHPNVLKTTLLNLGYEAFYNGTKTIREMRKVHNCNIPWIILMDPTSACNLHCTGCWAAEYGNKLNLSLDEMDSVVSQGKELGVYFYMLTGGEPLVRKKDIITLCKKHNDCVFFAYTNGTLVDEDLCRQMQEAGNLFLALSLEGKPEVNDLRRGEGVYGKVMHAMDLLKDYGLVFGTSICYTSQNIESVTSDEFIQMLVEKGCRYSLYFHYMPVGNDASLELLPTTEQRVYMHDRVREIRNMEHGPGIFTMDFQNDGEYVGGCIAGGRNYFHINANGDAEPCVFIHYSNGNIRENTILEILKQPLFMAYHDNQPFNENMLRPCPMLENPEILQKLVKETGAHSTDLQSPETAEHLCGKCVPYAREWAPEADRLWEETKRKKSEKKEK